MARRKNKRNGRELGYFVVVEGDTEQWYLRLFQHYYNLKMTIEPKLSGNSIKQQFKNVIDACGKGYKHVFWIVDFDTVNKENREARSKNKSVNDFKSYCQKVLMNLDLKDKITIIVNNPCFEYWYYLHKNQFVSKYYQTYSELLVDLKKFQIDNRLFEQYSKSKRDYSTGLFTKLLPFLKQMDFERLNHFDFDECQSKSVSEMYKLWQFLGIDNKM